MGKIKVKVTYSGDIKKAKEAYNKEMAKKGECKHGVKPI